MNMKEDSMRQALLTDLIDKMHSRLADKMFPDSNTIPMPNHDQGDLPAASDFPDTEAHKSVEEGAGVEEHGAPEADSTGIPSEEMTDEELEELMNHVINS